MERIVLHDSILTLEVQQLSEIYLHILETSSILAVWYNFEKLNSLNLLNTVVTNWNI